MKYSLICKNALSIVDEEKHKYKIEDELFEESEYQLLGSKRLRTFCNVGDRKLLVSTVYDLESKSYITKSHNVFRYNNGRDIVDWDDNYEYYITCDVEEAVQNHFNLVDIMRDLNDKIRRFEYSINNENK